jgi:UPF0755 protein
MVKLIKSKKPHRGKRILTVGILFLLFVLTCIFSGILFSIPSRTEEVFGPADPDLPLRKLYSQSIILLLSKDKLFLPVYPDTADFTYPVEPGDSLDKILSGLIQLDLVNHSQAFRAYLIYSGLDTRIQPGEYKFQRGMSELEIAQQLGNPQPLLANITILAGWRAEEIGSILLNSGLQISMEEFLAVVVADQREGYLFPATYLVERDIQVQELTDLFYQRFLEQITPALEEKMINRGLTLQETIILASIVEREAVLDEEMPLIASVFFNRLRAEINLAADPTIQYALGYNSVQQSWWTNPLSLEDLEYSSPYNTYLNPGLPPGPICNPGLAAINAVISPAETKFLYFRAACDGSGTHNFAETFEEHLQNACP